MSKKNGKEGLAPNSKEAIDPYQQQLEKGMALEAAGSYRNAAEIYHEIISKVPLHPQANVRMAALCSKYGTETDAEPHWQRAIEGDPENHRIRFGYGMCLYKLQKFAAAVDQYEQVLKILQADAIQLPAEEEALICQHLALALGRMDRYEEMEEYLEKAIKLFPGFAHAHDSLGYLRSLTGDSQGAIKHYRLAIEADPKLGSAHRSLANEKLHTEVDAEIESMEKLFEAGGVEPAVQMQLAFGLGKAYEDLGDYEKSFSYLKKGNDIHQDLVPYDVENEIKAISLLKEIYDPEAMADASAFKNPLVPVFIVGMPRTGSSLLEQIIASHSDAEGIGESVLLPQVCRQGVKDFPSGLKQYGPIAWRRNGESYLHSAQKIIDGQHFVVDKLLGNYRFLGVIRMMLPQAKIIHCVRDPMDVCLSAYKNIFESNAAQFSYDLAGFGKVYRHYELAMKHWEALMPGWMLKVQYEELITDPENQVRRILDYLGLPFENECLKYYESRRAVKTVSMSQVRKPIYKTSIKKWQNYEKQLQPFKHALSGGE